MPAVSKKQRKLMGLAAHHPEEVFKKNRGVLGMSKEDLSDFAETKEKGLPMHILPTGLKKIRPNRKR